jgi:hypothetical protein
LRLKLKDSTKSNIAKALVFLFAFILIFVAESAFDFDLIREIIDLSSGTEGYITAFLVIGAIILIIIAAWLVKLDKAEEDD